MVQKRAYMSLKSLKNPHNLWSSNATKDVEVIELVWKLCVAMVGAFMLENN